VSGVPDQIKHTTHRPVILAASDWPDMVALKEYAATLGADVEVSPLVESKHVRVVWVPLSHVGSAGQAVVRQQQEQMARHLVRTAEAIEALRPAVLDLASAFERITAAPRPRRSEQVRRMHRAYRRKHRSRPVR
jgi:hypothetical protein